MPPYRVQSEIFFRIKMPYWLNYKYSHSIFNRTEIFNMQNVRIVVRMLNRISHFNNSRNPNVVACKHFGERVFTSKLLFGPFEDLVKMSLFLEILQKQN